jgi:hypothetical protein
MGGDAAQRRSFMFDATNGMAVDAVLDILKAAADAEGQTISHGMVRMLSKLAVHAELGQEHVRPLADRALREQVKRLLSGWEIEDPNPGAYRKVLHHLASRSSASTVRGSAPQSVDEDDLRIVKMSLEVGEFGPLVDRTIDRVINNGGIGRVRQLLGSSPTGSEKAAEKLIARLRSPMSIACLVARMPFDVETLDELFPEIPVESYEVLLDALITSENRSTRRKLLDRLPRTALDVGGLIVARLDDERWYVQRNLLVLLQRLGRIPAGFSPMRWTEHPDARVRHEAIQLQLTLPGQRDLAVRASLQDVDSRIVRLGLLAVPHECSSELTPLVLNAVLNPKIVEEVRVIAAHALGRSRDRRALDALLNLVDGGRTLRGKPRLAPATPLCLAALRALLDGWTKHPQSSAMLALASGSSDPEVRKVATGPIAQ